LGFALTITLLVLSAVASALLQGGIFGFAGTLPPNYMQAAMTGNGLSGVTVSIIRVITKVTITIDPMERDEQKILGSLTLSSSIFFFFSAGTMILCLITYIIMMRSPFVQYYMRKVCLLSQSTINKTTTTTNTLTLVFY